MLALGVHVLVNSGLRLLAHTLPARSDRTLGLAGPVFFVAMLSLFTLLGNRFQPVATLRDAAPTTPSGHFVPTPEPLLRDDAPDPAADAPDPAATELLESPAVDRAQAAQHLVRTVGYQPERFARMRDEAVTAALADGVSVIRIAEELEVLPADVQRMLREHLLRNPSSAPAARGAQRAEPCEARTGVPHHSPITGRATGAAPPDVAPSTPR